MSDKVYTAKAIVDETETAYLILWEGYDKPTWETKGLDQAGATPALLAEWEDAKRVKREVKAEEDTKDITHSQTAVAAPDAPPPVPPTPMPPVPLAKPTPRRRPNNKPSPISNLPLETLNRIASYLEEDPRRASDPHALSALAATCKAFRGHFRLRGVRQQLLDAVVRGTRAGSDKRRHPLYYLPDAKEGAFGWDPFFLSAHADEKSDNRIPLAPYEYYDSTKNDGTLHLSLLTHSTGEIFTHSTGEIFTRTEHEVYLNTARARHIIGGHSMFGVPEDYERDWDDDLSGRLAVVTPTVMLDRFGCLTCDGAKEIRVTAEGMTIHESV
ncbi:hypothetical protein RQP46_002160 [Phenoliferia psychrophenolica]